MLASILGASIIVGRWLGPQGLGALAVLSVTVALAVRAGTVHLVVRAAPLPRVYAIVQVDLDCA